MDQFEVDFSKAEEPREEKDYRDKTFFISYEKNPENMREFKGSKVGNKEELETIMLVDENRDLLKRQKNIWNKKKKKYVKVLVDSDGVKMDGRDQLREKEKRKSISLKKRFKNWKTTNQVQIQKEGSVVDREKVKKFASMFQERKKQKFKVSKGKGEEPQRFQIKTAQQLLKLKKKGIMQKKINASRQTKKIRKRKENRN